MTADVVEKAKEALRAVHGAGLLHGDVHPRNFMDVDRGRTSREGGLDVVVLNFGFSEPIQRQAQCVAEMRVFEEFLVGSADLSAIRGG